jgi:hypothetical protein
MQLPDTIEVDVQKLMERVREGASPEDLMTEFGVPDRSILLKGLMHLQDQQAERIFVPGLIGRAAVEGRHTERGKRIDPAMLEGTDMPTEASDLDRLRAEAEADDRYAVTLDQGTIVFSRNV